MGATEAGADDLVRDRRQLQNAVLYTRGKRIQLVMGEAAPRTWFDNEDTVPSLTMYFTAAPRSPRPRRSHPPGPHLCADCLADVHELLPGLFEPVREDLRTTTPHEASACWEGVQPARAIASEEMATFETVVQALWCYTNMIATVITWGHGWPLARA